MRTNVSATDTRPRTHEGAPASVMSPLSELRRSVLACLLWERTFYEEGEDIADRIFRLAQRVATTDLVDLVKQARHEYRMRHAPLWLLVALTHRQGKVVGDTIADVVSRADELSEFVSLYLKEQGARRTSRTLSAQTKRGLAMAFEKFDAYQLAKYNRANKVKLRDVLFLCHAKPKNEAQQKVWQRLIDGTLEAPDTWEVALSGGADKAEAFTRLLQENRLGYMALLRNLRNMQDAGVDRGLMVGALMAGAGRSKALPFRFVAAARAVPSLESELDAAMQLAMKELPKLAGHTTLLVDVSASMGARLSSKSDLSRMDAAAALAALARCLCDEVRVFTFSKAIVEVPARHGMALIDAVKNSQRHMGTYLGAAIRALDSTPTDRLIVITDEQSHDEVHPPRCDGYLINTGSYQNGVGYGRGWKAHITGFSEHLLTYIREIEG